MRAAGVSDAFLERDAELNRLTAALDRAKRGQGGLVSVEGGLGTGKTSLLRAGIAHAEAADFAVLQARGFELETDFGFGVLRQLFERTLHAAPAERRKRLLSGAAALAAPMLGLESGQAGGDPFAGLHGIYWLVAQMADERPLVLVVDDAHWADSDSLRSLAYVANRLGELPVLLMVGLRAMPGETPLVQLPAPVDDIELAPLGEESVAKLVRMGLGQEGDPAFVAACRRVTAGNPLALAELLRELADTGVAPTAEAAATLDDRPPPRLARGILTRVKRSGRSAERLARAIAVLGGAAALSLATELAELQPDAAAQAAAALATTGILIPDASAAFAHPLIQSALYERIAPRARSRAHRRAAELVARSGDPDAAAVHLLAVEPAGEPGVVHQLGGAATHALAAGAPEAAARYLARALREPPRPEALAALLGQLGIAEVALGDRASLKHLEQARRAATDQQERATIAAMRAGAMTYFGEAERAIQTAQQALSELDDHTTPAATRLQAAAASLMWQEVDWVKRFETSLPGLLRLVDRGGPSARGLALTLSAALALRGDKRLALELVEAGLDGGAYLRDESLNGIELPQAMNALVWLEESDYALALGADILAEARRQGSIFGVIGGGIQLGLTLWRRGELAEAEAELAHADGLAAEHGAMAPATFSRSYLAQVRLARGRADHLPPEPGTLPEGLATSAVLTALEARAALRLGRGDRAGGIEDLRAVGKLLERLGTTSPGVSDWRSQLAGALAEDQPDEARALAEQDLRESREADLRVAEGVALRSLAATESGLTRIDLLEESVAALEPSFARLERARSLTDLGVALREAGKAEAARSLLLRALDQAHRCGAQPLAERARAEAVAAGARPRRPRLTGVEALTPSELRAARLASEGLSNREIAQALFVTKKTVADHLAASYRKLDISRRDGLTKALAEPTPNG